MQEARRRRRPQDKRRVGPPGGSSHDVRSTMCRIFSTLPPQAEWRDVLVIGVLAGIGFTMAIFIANRAFHDAALLAQAKLAVMGASLLAALLLGTLLVRRR